MAGCPEIAAATPQAVVIEHANIIDVKSGNLIPKQTIEILGERIRAVRSDGRVSSASNVERIDATGKFVIPGLWDMHVHLAGINADPKWSKGLLSLVVANGVTGVRDMGGNLQVLQRWQREIQSGTLIGPEIVASGPMLDSARDRGADVLPIENADDARRAVGRLKSEGADFIKVLSFLSRDSYFAVAAESKKQGLNFVGHVPNAISALEASEAGQKSIEHIYYSNIPIDCSAKASELRQRRLAALKVSAPNEAELNKVDQEARATFDHTVADALWAAFARNHTRVTPTLVGITTVGQLKPRLEKNPTAQYLPEGLSKKMADEYDLANAPAFAREAQNDSHLTGLMHRAGVELLAGSDSLDANNVPGFSIHRELELLVASGLFPLETLRTATVNPSKFFDRERQMGSVEAGKLADLVILDANPLADIANTQQISAVILKGRYLPRAALNRLLEEARHEAKQNSNKR